VGESRMTDGARPGADNLLTPVLLRRAGAGWRLRTDHAPALVAPRRRRLDWPRPAWPPSPITGERAETWSRPSALTLARRGWSRTSVTTDITTTVTTSTVLITRASRPSPPLTQVAGRLAVRVAAQRPAVVAATAGRMLPAPPSLTVTVLRPVLAPGRDGAVLRLVRVEPGRPGAAGPAGLAGPAGPAGAPGSLTQTVVVRRSAAVAAAPAVAAPGFAVVPAEPSAAAAAPVWSDDHLEDVAAKVLRSIERRAVAQRERMGRG